MGSLHSDLGTIAETVLAAGDSIEGSYGTAEPTNRKSGFDIEHRGIPLVIESDKGTRYQVQFNYRFSNALEYDEQTIRERNGLGSSASDEEMKQGYLVCLHADLGNISQSRPELIEEVRNELAPMQSKTVSLTHEFDGETFWDGIRFYDYLYPNADSYSVHTYRHAVHEVSTQGVTGGRILAQELDEMPDETDEAVAAESEEIRRNPAFQ